MTMRLRVCTKCGVEKFYEKFHKQGFKGRDPWCADCRNTYNKKYRAGDAQQEKRRLPESVQKWKAYNQSRRCFIRHLSRKYNVTWEQWETLIIGQCGYCAACEKQLIRYHIDHDHKTLRVRGVLCPQCNLALGAAFDSPVVLRSLANYVERTGG